MSDRPAETRRVWTFGGGKGGVGKSVICSCVGQSLARSGRRVVLLDADLGAANAHTLAGLRHPERTLDDFISGRVTDLEAICLPTPTPGLDIISGAAAILKSAQLRPTDKRRLADALLRLDVDVLLIDLGAGTHYTTLDFFNIGSHGLLVTGAEPTAIQNAYAFVKAALFRELERALHGTPIAADFLARAVSSQGAERLESVDALVTAMRAEDPDLADAAEEAIAAFRPRLIVNQAGPRDERRVSGALDVVCRRYLGLALERVATLPDDPAVHRAIRRIEPVLPQSGTLVDRIAALRDRLFAWELEPRMDRLWGGEDIASVVADGLPSFRPDQSTAEPDEVSSGPGDELVDGGNRSSSEDMQDEAAESFAAVEPAVEPAEPAAEPEPAVADPATDPEPSAELAWLPIEPEPSSAEADPVDGEPAPSLESASEAQTELSSVPPDVAPDTSAPASDFEPDALDALSDDADPDPELDVELDVEADPEVGAPVDARFAVEPSAIAAPQAAPVDALDQAGPLPDIAVESSSAEVVRKSPSLPTTVSDRLRTVVSAFEGPPVDLSGVDLPEGWGAPPTNELRVPLADLSEPGARESPNRGPRAPGSAPNAGAAWRVIGLDETVVVAGERLHVQTIDLAPTATMIRSSIFRGEALSRMVDHLYEDLLTPRGFALDSEAIAARVEEKHRAAVQKAEGLVSTQAALWEPSR